MMARWALLTATFLLILETLENLEIEHFCRKHTSILKWSQITCSKATSHFFETLDTPLNRTHWLKCENCSLNVIDERTFNFVKNNISYLELPHSDIRVLRKFAFHRFFLVKLLSLKNNHIESLEQKCFNGLKRLTQLDLSSNFIKIITNNIFSELSNLDILNLNRNKIFYIQPFAFVGLVNLKYFYINNNELKKLEERMFSYLSNLKILYIEHNDISEIHQNAFTNLKNLNYLYLNNNSISFLVQFNFKPLTSLINLQLRYNKLRDIQTSSFNGLSKLRYLYLGRNEITCIKPYGFIGLDHLEILELIGNKFEYIDFRSFDHMDRLKYLWLSNNLINNISIFYKSDVQNNFTVLDLSFNNLTFFNYKLLYNKMPNVKEIFVSNNTWKCEFFTNMFNFFEEKNISVCVSNDCSFNATDSYVDEICTYYFSNETEINTENSDFSTDCCPPDNKTTVVYIALILVYFVDVLF